MFTRLPLILLLTVLCAACANGNRIEHGAQQPYDDANVSTPTPTTDAAPFVAAAPAPEPTPPAPVQAAPKPKRKAATGGAVALKEGQW